MIVRLSICDCPHDHGFYLASYEDGVAVPAWFCERECGFTLNFNPETFPEGVAYVVHTPTADDKIITFRQEKLLKG